jgi:FkbM family methyltransferase
MHDFTDKHICIINTKNKDGYNERRNKNMHLYSKLHNAGFEIIFLYANSNLDSINIIKNNTDFYNLTVPTGEDYSNISLKIYMAYSYFNTQNVKGILKLDDSVYSIDDEIIDLDYYITDYIFMPLSNYIPFSQFYYLSNKAIKYILESNINPDSFKHAENLFISHCLNDTSNLKVHNPYWVLYGYIKFIDCIRLNTCYSTSDVCYICDMCILMRPFNDMYFTNENNIRFDHTFVESIEQVQVAKYINLDSVVLELGARYGTVSCIINKCIGYSTNQVCVEPDTRIQSALHTNKINNKCNFHILNGVVSRVPLELANIDSCNGYGTKTVVSTTSVIKSFTLEDVEAKYNLKFNTLVADCEGFLEQFFDENPHLYSQLSLIIFEKDGEDQCDYKKIIENLKLHNFKQVEYGSHEVWKK